MASTGFFSSTTLLLSVVTLFCRELVSGEHMMTIAVAVPGETTNTSIFETSNFSVGNVTSPNVIVLWSHVNQRDPFQMSRLLEELDRRGVNLLLLPDDKYTALSETATLERVPPSLLMPYTELETQVPQPQQSPSCDNDRYFSEPLSAAPDPDLLCNQTTVRVTEVEILAKVIRKLRWKQLLILYEESHEMAAADLTSNLSAGENKTRLLEYSLKGLVQDNVTSSSDEGGALYEALEALYKERQEELRVVLMCSVQCAKQVLIAASRFDVLNDRRTAMGIMSRWLLVLPPSEERALELYDLELDNVAAVIYCPSVVTFKDIQQELESILQTAYEYLSGANQTANATALSDAIRTIFQAPTSCRGSSVKTLLWKPEGRRLSEVGYISFDGQLLMEEGQDVFPNIKFGLNNRTFIVATLPWPSFVHRTGNSTYEGLCVDLIHQLQIGLNFSYVLTEPEDQEWGSLTANNTWTGLIGLLDRREVDMVVAPISVTAEREQAVDFTFPFYIDYTTVLLKLPDPADSKWKTLIQPFKPEVHMCIWITLLGATVITHTLEYFNPYYATNHKSMVHIGDMFWYLFGALLTQGGAQLPDSQTGRTMVSIFWLFSFVISAIYSGNLIAFLTVNKEEAPFDTLNGMVNQDLYTWGVPGGTSWTTLFQTSRIEVFKKIWAGIERERDSDPDILSMDPKVHLAKVKAGKYAFIGDKSTIDTWLKSECDLVTIKEEFLPMQYAIGLVNNSAYTRMFADEMLQINELGLTEIWKRRWWNKVTFCKGSLTTEATAIGLIDVQSAFYLIFIGLFLAIATLSFESLSHRFHLSSKLKKLFRCSQKDHRQPEDYHAGAVVISADGVRMRTRRNSSFRLQDRFSHTKATSASTSTLTSNHLGSEFQSTAMFY